MTTEELIADLDKRIAIGVVNLTLAAANSSHPFDKNRLYGKAEGLLVVKDWLRSY